jgi:hypothetical protein
VSVLYLYALTGERPRGRLGRGLGREPLEILPGRGFHIVAGRMATAPAATPAALRAHDAAVRRIAAAVDAILPMRFGSVAPDAETAARLFARRAVELAGRLVHVRGHAQMTVRIFGPRRARAAGRTVPAPADGPRPGPGARYLAARRRLHAAATAPELDPIRPLLKGLVADERVQRHGTPPLLASVYHLVPREGGARYRARLARGARELAPFRLTVTGPWPPYAFGADPWP